jgi:hypothetical protein
MTPSPVLAAQPVRGSARRVAGACLLAVVALFVCDALLFRTGLYTSILEPDSSTGLFENILRRERQAQARNGDNLVATLGDSRFAYYPRVCNELTGETGLVIRSAGIAGSDPRSWYYMLRDLDPRASRYRALVFGVDDYDDEDGAFNPYEDVRALHYVIARLRWRDTLEFARSFDTRALEWQAFRGALLKGFVFQSDLHAFLSHPLKRIAYVQLVHRGYEQWTYDFVDSNRTMTGLAVDWASWTAVMPSTFDDAQRDSVRFELMRKPAPQTGRMAGFRREWYGRILDRYRGSPTRIVFVRLPRGPVPRPDNLVHKQTSTIRDFASRPGVLLADEHAFESLERPELYKDALHLNDAGCRRFSAMLARELARVLGHAL